MIITLMNSARINQITLWTEGGKGSCLEVFSFLKFTTTSLVHKASQLAHVFIWSSHLDHLHTTIGAICSVKNPSLPMQETKVQSSGWEDFLEEEM